MQSGLIKYIKSMANQLFATQFEITVLSPTSLGLHYMMRTQEYSQSSQRRENVASSSQNIPTQRSRKTSAEKYEQNEKRQKVEKERTRSTTRNTSKKDNTCQQKSNCNSAEKCKQKEQTENIQNQTSTRSTSQNS